MSAPETRTDPAVKRGPAARAAAGPVGSTPKPQSSQSPKAAASRASRRPPTPATLIDIKADTMTLHTREAYGLFAGRAWDEAGIEQPIPGGKRAAAALNFLCHCAKSGHPYADWFLVCFNDELTAVRKRLAELVVERERAIETLKTKGLALNVLGSRQPLVLRVSFGTPYGYAIAEAVVEFDYFVRIIQTFVVKNRLSPDGGREATREVARPLRRVFAQVMRWESQMRSPQLQGITRDDFLPTAGEAARKRVHVAAARVGAIPKGVLDRTIVPSHVERGSEGATEEPAVGPSPEAPGVQAVPQSLL